MPHSFRGCVALLTTGERGPPAPVHVTGSTKMVCARSKAETAKPPANERTDGFALSPQDSAVVAEGVLTRTTIVTTGVSGTLRQKLFLPAPVTVTDNTKWRFYFRRKFRR
jgi:hypothetical protein